MHSSLEARIRAVYPTGKDRELVDDELDANDYTARVQYVLRKSRETLPLNINAQRWSHPLDQLAFTHADGPDFDTWAWSMDNAAKLRWIEENCAPYVVLWIKVSRVADYYVTYFNHWRPRGDSGYLDADFREEPNDKWQGYSNVVFNYLNEQGFLFATPELLQQREPFVLTWGGDEIPDDDPRWNDDDFEPDPVPASVYDCLFGDQ